MRDYPHKPAAFINALAEEGTKAEAIAWLQRTWNELCHVQGELENQRLGVLASQGALDHNYDEEDRGGD